MNKRSLKTKKSDIDWNAVDHAPFSDAADEDSPELSDAEFAELQPLSDLLPKLNFGKHRITIMLDDAIVQAYKAKAGGRGYQTLINETLRKALEIDTVKEALREVIREEMHPT